MTDAPPPHPSLLEAAAYLGMNVDTLRYHLLRSGHPARVWRDGRAYLPMSLAEADQLVQARRRASVEREEEVANLPGLSARRVAELLGIQQDTVYRLAQLMTLPAEWEIMVGRQRHLRWAVPTVKAYAERRGRPLDTALPLPHTSVDVQGEEG